MGRWLPNAKGRLAKAALELYIERGYDQTTVAEIAERAGLTKRTFFRHYADKRDVLFGGTDELAPLLVDAVMAAPAGTAAYAAAGAALSAAGVAMAGSLEQARLCQVVIAEHPDLQERRLGKLAEMGAALTGALRERGFEERTARLATEAGIAAFKVAFEQWVAGPEERDLPALVEECLAALAGAVARD